jgi:hypothetical protein
MSSLGLRKAGAFDPDLFAFECTLELLQYAQFVVSAIDSGFILDFFKHLLLPGGRHNAGDGDRFRLRKGPTVAAHMASDEGQGVDNGLIPVVAPERQALENRRQHAPVVARKFPLHDGLAE